MKDHRNQPLWTGLTLLPILICGIWSAWPSIKSSAAVASYKLSAKPVEFSSLPPVELQRKIQKHFLSFGIYIPTNDIVVANTSNEQTKGFDTLIRKLCGNGSIYIWVPLRFRVPVWGEKITEWCLAQ